MSSHKNFENYFPGAIFFIRLQLEAVGLCERVVPWTFCPKTSPLIFGGSRSFKFIDVPNSGKLVGSACYDKQQVCVYLQPFSR